MNWLTNFIRPKIRSFVDEKKDVPDNLWHKCPSCEGMLFHRDLKEKLNVCYHCGHHMKISVEQRLGLLFDDGKYNKVSLPKVAQDPLKFKDRRKYADRLKETQHKTKKEDAIVIAKGQISGNSVVIAAFDFSFMGGSMGAAVGEGLVKAAEEAVKDKAALLAIPASGGARMQEGMISLMQMPRSTVAVQMVKDEGLPYLVLLTDPTTGGVSASFAMLGDIHIAEPGCMIGFAGKRVIQETIREELPDDFQTAEYCLEHGMVDMVVPREKLAEIIGRVTSLLMNKTNGKQTDSKGENAANNKTGKASGKNKEKNSKGRKEPANSNRLSPSAAQKTTPKKKVAG